MFAPAHRSLFVFVPVLLLNAMASPAHALDCTGQPDGTPCDDGLFCTLTDECIGEVCVGSGYPCLPGEGCDEAEDKCTCSQDGDCDDSNICTDDSCEVDTCVHTHNTEMCDDNDSCTEGDQCDYGWCVGLRVAGCCHSHADCDDQNPCTEDTCNGETEQCEYTNQPPDTACGSPNDDECTDPDTCDGAGTCLLNNAEDGTSCPDGECLAGMCEPVRYDFVALDEGENPGSEPRGGTCHQGNLLVVGRVIDVAETDHAFVWHSPDGGETWGSTLLPGPPPSVANDIAAEPQGSDLCVAVGHVGGPPQPAAWENPGSGWTLVTLPVPVGGIGGSIADVTFVLDAFCAVGYTVGPSGFHHAVFWKRDQSGDWMVYPLPDYGAGRHSEATSVTVCPADASPELCAPGALLIAGSGENESATTVPLLWTETALDSGVFEMQALPLPAGAVEATRGISGLPNDAWLDLTSTVLMNDGVTAMGVLWTTPNLTDWTTTALTPLVGYTDSMASGVLDLTAIVEALTGTSYLTGEDPLTHGVATGWQLDTETFELDFPYNFNDLILDLPLGCTATRLGTRIIADSNNNRLVVFACPGGRTARDTLPHAAVLFAQPQNIPAVTEWGLVVMALLGLVAGTVMFRARRQPT